MAGAEAIPDAEPSAKEVKETALRTTALAGEQKQSLTATIKDVEEYLERLRVKRIARGALEHSDNAALLTMFGGLAIVAAGFTAGLAPALLLGIGGIVGLTGGVEWYNSNRYQELTIDPPRDDIDIVSHFKGLTFNLPAPADDFEARWQAFIMKTVSTAVCLGDLIRSLERVDGALMVQGRRGVQSVPQLPIQRAAVQHNATACAKLLRELSMLTQPTNEAWHTLMDILRRHQIDPAAVSPQDAHPAPTRISH
jgi:hypothetical protein